MAQVPQDPPARASPQLVPSQPKLSEDLRKLIYQNYDEMDKRVEVINSIDSYLDRLNSRGKTDEALRFLQDEEVSIRQELAQKPKKERRALLKMVLPGTLTALVMIAAKVISFAVAS